MEHDQYSEWLQLSVFDELDKDRTLLLEEHIQSCDSCQLEKEELSLMLESITASGAGEPTDTALANARQQLGAALWNEPRIDAVGAETGRRESILSRWFGAGRQAPGSAHRGGWFQGYRLALAGTAMICVGFLAGFLVFGGVQPVSQPPEIVAPANESFANVSNVQFLNADASDGEIELLYDQVRPMRLKAGMDDQRMRRLLAQAILTGSNPGVRLKAINAFETGEHSTPLGDVKQAFLGALISDPNAGVRRQALLALQELPYDDVIKETLMYVLAHDENPGLRVAAMNYLTAFTVDGDISEEEYFDILDKQ